MNEPYIDQKYIRLISTQLRNYKEKKNDLINFSCPICGDSTKDKKKARGYFYLKQNKWQYKCHNCNVGMSAGNLIKSVNPDLWKEWKAEKFRTKYKVTKPKPKFNNTLFKKKTVHVEMESLNNLEDDHVAILYVKSRSIPKEQWHRIFYTENINPIAKKLGYDEKFPIADMIVFKFKNTDNNTTHIQGRYIDPESKQFRFVTLDVMKDQPKIFGQETIDPSKPIFVVEAPIDSLFLPNCISDAGSGLNKKYNYNDVTIVLDREPKNPTIVKIMNKCIDMGNKITILPNNIIGKDINDYVKNGYDPLKLIQENTYQGIQAKLKMTQFR